MASENNKSRTRKVITSIFNVRGWLDYDRIRAFTSYLGTGIKKMTVPQKPTAKNKRQSFSDMAIKMGLTKEQLQARGKGLYRLSLLMSAIGLCLFGYCIYHLFYASFKAAIVSFVVSLIAEVLAFRYHFWYFQIKEHKLGCTFKEWYQQGLLGKDK